MFSLLMQFKLSPWAIYFKSGAKIFSVLHYFSFANMYLCYMLPLISHTSFANFMFIFSQQIKSIYAFLAFKMCLLQSLLFCTKNVDRYLASMPIGIANFVFNISVSVDRAYCFPDIRPLILCTHIDNFTAENLNMMRIFIKCKFVAFFNQLLMILFNFRRITYFQNIHGLFLIVEFHRT